MLCMTSRSSSRPACEQLVPGLDVSDDRHRAVETRRRAAAAAYLDLDGTLLGRGGSLLHDADGAFSLLGARALEACARAGVEVVLVLRPPARRRWCTTRAADRACASFIYEAGRGLVLDGEVDWLTGGLVPRDGRTIHDQIAATGRAGAAARALRGRLEYHDPWHRGPRRLAPVPRPGRRGRGRRAARRARPRRAAAGRQRGDPAAADAGGRAPARLPPGAARRRPRRAPWPATCRPAATRRRTASRSATRARTSAPRRPSARSGWWPTDSSATRRRDARAATSRVAEGLTAPASTRR